MAFQGIELNVGGTQAGTIFSTNALTSTLQSTVNANVHGIVFQAHENATITHLGIALRSSTGTPGTMRLELRAIDTTTGVVATATAALAVTSTLAYNDASWIYSTAPLATMSIQPLTASYNITAGTHYAVVIKAIGGTWNASNSVTVCLGLGSGHPAEALCFPTGLTGNSKITGGIGGCYTGTGIGSKGYGKLQYGHNNLNTGFHNSTMFGNQFTIPASFGNTIDVIGITTWGNMNTTANEYSRVQIYTVSGSTATSVYSEDFQQTARSNSTYHRNKFVFSTPYTMSPGTTYIIAIGAPLGDQIQTQYYNHSSDQISTRSMTGNFLTDVKGVSVSGTTISDTNQLICINPVINNITATSGGGGSVSITGSFSQGFSG